MKIADSVFRAIADPTRRKIIEILAQSESSVRELTASFDISQPAVSQHLKQLRDSKLVTAEKVGLEQHYRLTPGPLREVYGWVSDFKPFFDPAGHAWILSGPPRQPAKKTVKKGGPADGR
jgi:DNA-binding transcriptional ArsR family regulator